jgi:hypothetical protein
MNIDSGNKHRQWQLTFYFISNTTKVILISYYMNSIREVLDFKSFRNLGVSGKIFSSLGKIWVCPEKFFDSQNGTLTENVFWGGGSPKKKNLSRGPKVAEKGPDTKYA